MSIRAFLAGVLLLAAGCTEEASGPIAVSAIGGEPSAANPNLAPLDPPSAFLLQGIAQGLVRFDAAGEIEPALAQSWIVSDDGLRYTFRIRRTDWTGNGRATAAQVVQRLRAALSGSSRNPLKPIFGAVGQIEAMTDEVLEITLQVPHSHFLELLAQPEMAILMGDRGTGPYQATTRADGSLLLTLPQPEDEEEEELPSDPPIALRGERAAPAVARFIAGGADLVTGGTAGELPILRAAAPPRAAIQFDPVGGLFGLVFQRADGPLADPAVRRALSMALDRESLVAALAVPDLLPRATLLPTGLDEVPQPAAPDWTATPLVLRRQEAAGILAAAEGENRIERLRVAMPEGPGWRLVFAFLRRDWRAIGIDAVRVAPGADAELRFVDQVAPSVMTAWYLHNFTCDRMRVCSPEADQALAAARETQNPAERRALLAEADRAMSEAVLFVPIAAPVRWSLVSPRLTGFRRNQFGLHTPSELIAEGR